MFETKLFTGPDRALRIATLVLSLVPLVLIFSASAAWDVSSAGDSVGATPPGWFFITIWVIVILLYIVIGAVLAFHAISKAALIAWIVMATIFGVLGLLWQYTYADIGTGQAGNVLGVALWIGLLTWTVLLYTKYNDDDNKTAIVRAGVLNACLYTVVVTWLLYAVGLNIADSKT